MARLKNIDRKQATGKAKELLEKIQAKFGATSNLMRALANGPAVLDSYFHFYTTLAAGALDRKLHDQIALVVAEANGCEYCLSAHTALGRRAGLTSQQLVAARDLSTGDARVDAALRFARDVVTSHGHLSDAQFDAVRQAGYSDEEIVEIIGHVAANIFTNYFNNINRTELDIPRIEPVRNKAA